MWVGRAGERAGVRVCGCAGVQGGIGRWSLGVIWYDSANGISTNWFSTARKIECEGQGSSCSLGCVRFGDDEKP